MTEGTAKEADAGAVVEPTPAAALMPEQAGGEAQPDMHPKEREGQADVQLAQEQSAAGAGQELVATGDWWCSSSVAARTGALLPTPSFSGAHLTWWWKRRLTDGDEDREWSYSTTPGSQTMEQLQEHFGEASFLDPGSW